MAKEIRTVSTDDALLGYSNGIAALLRSAAHPARMQIMALILRGDSSLASMMLQTSLSKTALANHLNQLVESGLVQRTARGKYELTVDGRELLGAASAMYKSSKRRAEERRAHLQRRYSEAFAEASRMEGKVISKKAEYQSCWLSYTGAMAGSLTALGAKCDIVDVGGISGMSFIINVSKNETCPSGPTAIHIQTFKQILRATESLGYRIEPLIYSRSYPTKPGSPTAEELKLVGDLFERIKRELNEHDRPVVLWGLAAPEYGIVNGYDGKSYVVSTFRSALSEGKPEDPIPHHDLKAAGCIDTFFFREETSVDRAKAVRDALRRAVEHADGKMPVARNYVAGPSALEEWARVLEELPDDKQNYMGNSYVGQCVAEGRQVCSSFLKRIAKEYPSKQASILLEASEAYEQGAKVMDEFARLFPFKFEGEMSLKDRKKGAELLRKVRTFEEQAIAKMKQFA